MVAEHPQYNREGEWAHEIKDAKRPRMVVTGIGLITPQGVNTESTWQNIIAGRTGIHEFDFAKMAEEFDVSDLSNYPTDVKVAATLPSGYSVEDDIMSYALRLPPSEDDPAGERKPLRKAQLRRMSKSVQLSVAATAQALTDAGLLIDGELLQNIDADRIATHIGTIVGGMGRIPAIYKDLLEIQDPKGKKKRLSPFEPLIIGLERVSSVPSIVFGLTGAKDTVTDACATGSQNIIAGTMDILNNDADIIIVGGVDAPLDPITFEIFAEMPALSKERDPNKASRPFDISRDGFVMGEGAGILIIEREEYARARHAKIYAELAGFGRYSDATHDTEPSGKAAEKSLRRTFQRAGLPDKGTIYINAHGTSTVKGDRSEVNAYRKVISELPSQTEFSISSTKSGMGHLMGASGSAEAGVAILALRDGIQPATLHLDTIMEEGDEINLIPNDAQHADIELSFTGSFGFGGSGTNMAFKKYTG